MLQESASLWVKESVAGGRSLEGQMPWHTASSAMVCRPFLRRRCCTEDSLVQWRGGGRTALWVKDAGRQDWDQQAKWMKPKSDPFSYARLQHDGGGSS